MSKKSILWILSGFIVIVSLVYFQRGRIAEWRCRSILEESRSLAADQKMKLAVQRALAARQLDPANLDVLRHLHSIHESAGARVPVDIAADICRHPGAGAREVAHVLASLLRTGALSDYALVYSELEQRLKNHEEIRFTRARWFAGSGEFDKAERELQALLDETGRDRYRLGLAQIELARGGDKRDGGLALLEESVTSEDRSVALEAARLVARLSPSEVSSTLSEAVQRTIHTSENATADDLLFAYTLQIRDERPRREEIIDQAIGALADSDLHGVAKWLNRMGESRKTIELIANGNAAETVEGFEIFFTALMLERKWEEARAALESPPPALGSVRLNVFKAAVATKREETSLANRHWQMALKQASWDRSRNHYATIHHVAETVGAESIAMEALMGWYKSKAPLVPDLGQAERLVRWLSDAGRDEDMLAVLKQLVRRGLQHPSITNTLSYFEILYGENVEQAVSRLKELVAEFPGRMDYRTSLALGLLSLGRPKEALDALSPPEPFDWSSGSEADRAVYGKVLAANGRKRVAAEILGSIDRDALHPKERELLDSL